MVLASAAVPECAEGHQMVCVTRGGRQVRVCPGCLSDALSSAARRELSVNDFLARYEADGALPSVGESSGRAVSELLTAARQLFGDSGSKSCRRVVRRVAEEAGVSTAEVMRWNLKQLEQKLSLLRAA